MLKAHELGALRLEHGYSSEKRFINKCHVTVAQQGKTEMQ